MRHTRLAFLLLLFFSTSVSWAQRFKYYYYPEVNVYYDLLEKQYVFKDNDIWMRNYSLPAGVERLGLQVPVRYDSKEIWYVNHLHKKQYLNGDFDPLWTIHKAQLPFPQRFVPEVGSCRLWQPNLKPSEQTIMADEDCNEIRQTAKLGEWIISHPKKHKVTIEKISNSNIGVVRELEIYYVK